MNKISTADIEDYGFCLDLFTYNRLNDVKNYIIKQNMKKT